MSKENKTLDVNLTKPSIYYDNYLIEATRNVDVAKHIPQDIIGKGAEFQTIRDLNNKELSRIWAVANKVLRNTFIHLADEEGLRAYERLISEEITADNIEGKRSQIYAIWNRVSVWTDRTLRGWLDNVVGKDKYRMGIKYNEYELFVEIIYDGTDHDMEFLHKQIRLIIPANLGFGVYIWFGDELRLTDSTKSYLNRFYITGHEHQCGTIFKHQYRGKRIRDNIQIKNNTTATEQRSWYVGEPKSGIMKAGD